MISKIIPDCDRFNGKIGISLQNENSCSCMRMKFNNPKVVKHPSCTILIGRGDVEACISTADIEKIDEYDIGDGCKAYNILYKTSRDLISIVMKSVS